MNEMTASFPNINPRFQLIASRAIASLRPSLISFLVANRTRLGGNVANPISFCNVLFIGNFCAALSVGFIFGFKGIIRDLLILSPKFQIGLFINGSLSAILSGLIFLGLEYTTVTNAVLLGRLGPVLYAVAGSWVFGRKITKAEWFGFSLIVIGIFTIVFKANMYKINLGDLLIIASSFVYAITSLMDQLMLSKDLTVRVIVFNRNLVSSLIFFVIASSLFGFSHFMNAFSGKLWIIMLVYALFTIVVEQFLWYSALDKLESSVVSRWTSISPIFGVFYAYLLNGERPNQTQLIAFVVTMVGVFIAGLGKGKSKKQEIMIQPECTVSIN